MSNPAHKELWPKLSAFVDGELSVEERKQIEQLISSDKALAGLVADLRAGAGLTRLTYEAAADEVDFKDFANQVLEKVGANKESLGFFEGLRLRLTETFTYQRPMLVTGFATAMALLIAVPFGVTLMQSPAGYGAKDVEVQSVSVSSESRVRPIVYENDKGDAIIWTVEEPDKAVQKTDGNPHDEKSDEIDVDSNSAEKKAGEL
jgi:anti-sigma factor RsiW